MRKKSETTGTSRVWRNGWHNTKAYHFGENEGKKAQRFKNEAHYNQETGVVSIQYNTNFQEYVDAIATDRMHRKMVRRMLGATRHIYTNTVQLSPKSGCYCNFQLFYKSEQCPTTEQMERIEKMFTNVIYSDVDTDELRERKKQENKEKTIKRYKERYQEDENFRQKAIEYQKKYRERKKQERMKDKEAS